VTVTGAFGDQTPITITGYGAMNKAGDSVALQVNPPFTGMVFFVRGRVDGVVTHGTFNVNATMNGEFGEHQMMYKFQMNGALSSNGYVIMRRASVTDVSEDRALPLSSYPQPFVDAVTVSWSSTYGSAERVGVTDLLGNRIDAEVLSSSVGSLTLSMPTASTGTYLVTVHTSDKVLSSVVLR
jgi:hypothetical protein